MRVGRAFVEARPVSLATRVTYIAQIAIKEEFDLASALPLMVIDGTYAPAYGPGNKWLPGASTIRVFSSGDEDLVRGMDVRFAEPLFDEICSLSGMHPDEVWACGWRIVKDGQWAALFVIAEKLGMTVHELCERMPSYELTWWIGWLNYQASEQERAMAESRKPAGDGFVH